MHHSLFVYILIHLHVFLASYLFTISIIHIVPRHHSDVFSTIVLVLALAGHIILSKTIYPTSLSSVPRTEVEIGSIMEAQLLIYNKLSFYITNRINILHKELKNLKTNLQFILDSIKNKKMANHTYKTNNFICH